MIWYFLSIFPHSFFVWFQDESVSIHIIRVDDNVSLQPHKEPNANAPTMKIVDT